jgi:4-amino-4-deoxy-L-arabinose transferase-like glycosyltransferase
MIQEMRKPQGLIVLMILFQLAWFVAMWYTGAAANNKLPLLIGYTLLAGLVVVCLPVPPSEESKRRKLHVFENTKLWLWGLCILTFLVGLIYIQNQRVWPFDEEGNFGASQLIAEQGIKQFFNEYPTLPWLGRQHPPLIILINGLMLRLFGIDLFVIRLVTLFFTVVTLILIYLVGASLYDRKIGLLAACFMASFPLFIRLGTAAMTDVQVTFFAVLAVYLVIKLERRPTYGLAATVGVELGLGLTSKYTLLLMFPVILSYFIVFRSFRRCFVHLLILGFVSGSILLTWLGYAYTLGVFAAQHQLLSELASSAKRTSAANEYFGISKLLLESLFTRLPSALGVYTLPLILLGLFHILRQRQKTDLFILFWVILIWAPLMFTLPDHRYFMLSFPALAIMMGRGMNRISGMTKQVVLISLLYCGGALYLFVDWFRLSNLIFK